MHSCNPSGTSNRVTAASNRRPTGISQSSSYMEELRSLSELNNLQESSRSVVVIKEITIVETRLTRLKQLNLLNADRTTIT